MAWVFSPVLPTGATFDGEMVYPTTDLEIPDDIIQMFESVNHEILPQFENKYTGFQTKKYRVEDSTMHRFSFMLVGNLQRWMQVLLQRLAIAINGSGMSLRFTDTWLTPDLPTTYDCRWINAGDFVDNSTLLCGASMELISFTPDGLNASRDDITEYQKVIAGGTDDWILQISTGEEMYRVA